MYGGGGECVVVVVGGGGGGGGDGCREGRTRTCRDLDNFIACGIQFSQLMEILKARQDLCIAPRQCQLECHIWLKIRLYLLWGGDLDLISL